MSIAIVGAACRVPGAETLPELWQLLHDGVTVTGPVPPDRFHGPTRDPGHAPDGSGFGGFLPSVRDFDHEFFSISAAEAAEMDPQQRLFLEVAWHCLEHAAVPAPRLAGSATGVYVGQSTFDHAMAVARRGTHQLGPYTNTGLSHAVTANRLSYLWDLRGPSLTVDTACSSSLVAVHLAVRALRAGDCDLALAGGVNVLTSPVPHVGAARLTALSPDGQCRAFDRSANGYVRAEGAAALLLKRLADARRDGDRVLAVIHGTAVNQDGRTNGLTAPSGRAQTAVVTAALADAGMTVDDIDYVEAHGTGTPLGDPIEARGLGVAFTGRSRPLPVGSVKANLGHLESAAGITGLLKAVLMLEHRTMPGIANLRTVNPLIDPDRFNLLLAPESLPWPHQDPIATVAVSSFGFGGTNAHVIVSSDNDPQLADRIDQEGQVGPDSQCWWLPISGRTHAAVRTLAGHYAQLLSTDDAVARTGIVQAAVHRRRHHEIRAAGVGRDADDLVAAVQAIAAGVHSSVRVTTDREPRVVFVFSGHGSQWMGMGRDLLATEPRFVEAARRCEEAFAPLLGWSVIDAIDGTIDEGDVAVIQPLIFTVQVALAAALRGHGVLPDAVIGHSVGEVAAAVAAGQLGINDGARIVVSRNEAVRSVRGTGGMLVVDLAAEQAQAFLAAVDPPADTVAVAASNSPRNTVLSGATDGLNRVAELLRAAGHEVRPVNVDYPSHSPAMTGPADHLNRNLGPVEHQAGTAVYYSSVTGASAGTRPLPSDYWAQNLLSMVDFGSAVAAATTDGATHLIELSPHPVLLPALRECVADRGERVAVLHTLHRDDRTGGGVGGVLARLYETGWTPTTAAPCPAPPVPLPGYPFNRALLPAPETESLHIDAAPGGRRPGELTVLGWLPDARSCDVPTTFFGPAHRVGGTAVAAAHGLALGMRHLARDSGIDTVALSALRITRPVPAGDNQTARVTLLTPAGNEPTITVAVQDGATWVVAATARLPRGGPRQPAVEPANRHGHRPPGIDLETRLNELGAGLGVGAEWLTGLTVTPAGEAHGRIDPAGHPDHQELPVGLGNAAVLVLAAAVLAHHPLPAGAGWVVTGIDELVLPDDPVHGPVDVTATVAQVDPTGATGTVTGRDPSGRPVLHMAGITLAMAAGLAGPDPGRDSSGVSGTAPAALSLPESPSRRRRALHAEVCDQLAQVLPDLRHRGRPDDRSFADLGLDSLTAVELRNRLERRLGLRLSVALLWANPTPAALVEALIPLTGAGPTGSGHSTGSPGSPREAADDEPGAPGDDASSDASVTALLAELAAEIDAAGFDATSTASKGGTG